MTVPAPSRRVLRAVAGVLGAAALMVACTKVPYTDRKQFNVIPKGTMTSLGQSTYKEELAKSTVLKEGRDADTLDKVGKRISNQADEPDYAWRTSLLKEDVVNAWCLPGGYIGFYTGILPVLQHEAGMGFVMGHEVGHALAHHGAERMSQQLGLAGALSLIDLAVAGSGKVNEQQRGIIAGALGLGAQYGVVLPFSRAHEKEADIIGIMLMAEAGYPPRESIPLWDRMGQVSGKAPPAFLSTHPSNAARQENLQEWMPQARKKYERNKRDGEDSVKPIW